jgi:head-tail adaptor
MPNTGAGTLREQLVIQENAPDPIPVTSLTRASATATAITAIDHGYTTGDFVTIAGAAPAGYNGKFKITVTGPATFTFTVSSLLATPATGAITVTYFSDAQGGKKIGWEEFDRIWAEMIPMGAMERLQAQALTSRIDYKFRARTRPDITPEMRALWTPSWPPPAPTHTLEIHGVLPWQDGRTYMVLECGELA